MKIKQALETLDHSNNDQWTEDGLPTVEVVRGVMGNEKITRKDITDAAPEFRRIVEDSKPDEGNGEDDTDSAPIKIGAPVEPDHVDSQELVEPESFPTLEAHAAHLDQKVNELDMKIGKIKDERNALAKRRESIQDQIFRSRNSSSQAAENRAWIKSQNEARAKRVESQKAVMAAMVSIPQDEAAVNAARRDRRKMQQLQAKIAAKE